MAYPWGAEGKCWRGLCVGGGGCCNNPKSLKTLQIEYKQLGFLDHVRVSCWPDAPGRPISSVWISHKLFLLRSLHNLRNQEIITDSQLPPKPQTSFRCHVSPSPSFWNSFPIFPKQLICPTHHPFKWPSIPSTVYPHHTLFYTWPHFSSHSFLIFCMWRWQEVVYWWRWGTCVHEWWVQTWPVTRSCREALYCSDMRG